MSCVDTPTLDLIVLTYNEELHLRRCLRSVQGLTQNIFVVDSGSTDSTVDIAHQYNAHVVTHKFTTQAEQFNCALDNLPIKSDWILRLDADEYLLPDLRDEITSVLPQLPAEVSGLYMKRRMVFMGRWIRHGGYYPTWILRLFRYGKARSEQAELNEHILLSEGEIAYLELDFVDEDHEGLASWTLKHEGYSTRQARFINRMRQGYGPDWIEAKFSSVQAKRKRWLMNRLYAPAPLFVRAFLYFLYRYILRLGFLDGVEGLIFHFLHGCWYPFYTDAKLFEQRLRDKNSCAESQAQLTGEQAKP